MSAGGQDKAAYRAAGPGKMGFKKGAYGSAKGVRAKAANLSDAQLKRAGGAKAAAKRTVDIGSTSRVAGKTLGPGGKPLTGSVKLANGKMAVYKAGKRVINVKRSGGGSDTGSTGLTAPKKSTSPGMNLTADQRAKLGAIAKSKSTTGSSAVSQRATTQTSRARTKAAMQRNKTKSATFVAPGPNANRPSFAKQEAAVAKALVDFRNATSAATIASAKRRYDQQVAVLNSIRDYFR